MEKASKSNLYYQNLSLLERAKELRKNSTPAEIQLWKYVLRAGNMKGYKFRRQRPTLNYILDFVNLDLLLVIEVDGEIHDLETQIIKDKKRDAELAVVGFTTLRFSNFGFLILK